ncbi:nucleotide exchange factor GrpE [Candidatus Nomurabacteria bacterium]|nr:nucleotide exchange factor GrpE [Candidatus Nomurabacteria bacterium]
MSKAKNKKQKIEDVSTQVADDQRVVAGELELVADLQRLQAEFINYKNRVEAEKATLSQFSKAQTIKDLLPVIDDLERALLHQPEGLKNDKWASGVLKIHDRLIKQLEKIGVTKIDALNKPFDHNLHEAVEVSGEGSEQVVSEVLQNGYMLASQVIRHSVVKVENR